MSSLYSIVQSTIDGLSIGEMTTIPKPDKLKAFRKFLTEISKKDHKKFTTKLNKDKDEMHILRINYYSVSEKIEENV